MPKKHSTSTPRDAATPAPDPRPASPKNASRGHVTPKGRAVAKRPSPEQPPAQEILPPPLSKSELRPMINKARRHSRAVKRNTMQLAASLRQLQDAGAHLTYGRKSFPQWAATEFADLDLTPDAVKKLVKAGRALLLLDREGRIDLSDPRTIPATTGARALSAVISSHGEQAALEVFDACPPEGVVATNVNAAAGALLPPPPATAQRASDQSPPDEDDEDDEPEEIPQEVEKLRNHVERLHDYLHDISCADDADPIAVTRAYDHFLSDAQALKPVLAAVLPSEDEQSKDKQ